jgi:hypothetical protein
MGPDSRIAAAVITLAQIKHIDRSRPTFTPRLAASTSDKLPTLSAGAASSTGTYPATSTTPATVIRDGRVLDRKMDRWTFYKHTEPLRLVRGRL